MNNKQDKTKNIIVIIILFSALIAAYIVPRAHYKGTSFISRLNIPTSFANWKGKDIQNSLNLDFDKNWNKFISEALIYEYRNKTGNRLNFIILDAGNFHHPNVCFTASGYEITELADTEFSIQGRSFKAHTLFTHKENESNLSFYWIIIDKNIVHSWIRQKIKQLYFSLFNRERVGLMVRIDIPAEEGNLDDAKNLARQFASDLNLLLDKEKASFIFGE